MTNKYVLLWWKHLNREMGKTKLNLMQRKIFSCIKCKRVSKS